MGYPGQPTPPPGFPMNDGQGYGPQGPSDDRLWSLLAYLLTFVASFVGPLIIYAVKMNESRFVRYHAAQALNMQITAYIYAAAAFFFGLILAIASHGVALVLLIPLFVIFAIAHLVYLILAAIASNRGEYYSVPTLIALPLVH